MSSFVSASPATARAVGRAFGQLLIAVGLLPVIFVGAFGGICLAFTGWFLLGAAEGEVQAAATRDALAGLDVSERMVPDPSPSTPASPCRRSWTRGLMGCSR